MTMPGSYLPPIVTELKGDTSDLIQAFAEAKAAEKAFAESTRAMADEVKSSTRGASKDYTDFSRLVVQRAKEGESATATLRRELKRTADEVEEFRRRVARGSGDASLYAEFRRANGELERMRSLARRIAPELLQGARTIGQRFGIEFAGALSGASSLIIPAIVGVVVLALPVISALIGSAVAVGLALGFAGIGILVAAMLDTKIKQQFYRIGQNFKAAFKNAISGAFDDELRAALRTFNLYIPIFGAQFRKIFDAVAPILDPLSANLGEGIKVFLDEIIKAMPQIVPLFQEWAATIPEVMQALGEFLVTITEDGPALARFISDAANALVVFLGGAANVISWLTSVYGWVVKLNDAFPFMSWQRQLEGLGIAGAAIGAFFVDLWNKIVTGAKAVGGFFADLGTSIWDWLKDAGGAVADWFNATVEWFKKLPGQVVGFLASMPGRVQAVVSDMAHRAAYWVGWLVGQWFRFITEAPGKIVAAVSELWGFVANKTREGIDRTIINIRAFPGQVAAFFAALWTSVTGWVSRTYDSVVAWFARTKAAAINLVASAITTVIAWFKSLPGQAAAQGAAFRDRIVKFFSDTRKWLIEAGKNVVRGFIDGVSGMWNWAVDKVKSFAHDIWSGFQDALGIHSPSVKFAESGENSARGYLAGWRNIWRKAKAEITGGTMTITGVAPGGAPRPPGAPPPGGGNGGPSAVHTDVYLDGHRVARAITPALQQRADRSGPTGLGFRAPGIM